MSRKVYPVKCGCGGTVEYLDDGDGWWLRCLKCGILTDVYDTEEEAINAWNTAMGRKLVVDSDCLPCPFCGSPWIDQLEEGFEEDGNPQTFCVCEDCGATAEFKVWNRRINNDDRTSKN